MDHHFFSYYFYDYIDIYTIICYYIIRREVNRLSKRKRATKKPTKHSIEWQQTLVGALVDLMVGVALLLIAKYLE